MPSRFIMRGREHVAWREAALPQRGLMLRLTLGTCLRLTITMRLKTRRLELKLGRDREHVYQQTVLATACS